MADFLLKSAVGMTMARDRVIDRVKNKNEDGADIVQTIIIIAMFVLICMVIGGILMSAIQEQGDKVGECIRNSNSGQCTEFRR